MPGLGRHGRWAFAEFNNGYAMRQDFAGTVETAFGRIVDDAREHTSKRII